MARTRGTNRAGEQNLRDAVGSAAQGLHDFNRAAGQASNGLKGLGSLLTNVMFNAVLGTPQQLATTAGKSAAVAAGATKAKAATAGGAAALARGGAAGVVMLGATIAQRTLSEAEPAAASVIAGSAPGFYAAFQQRLFRQMESWPLIGQAAARYNTFLGRAEAQTAGELGNFAYMGGRVTPEMRKMLSDLYAERSSWRETEETAVSRQFKDPDFQAKWRESHTELPGNEALQELKKLNEGMNKMIRALQAANWHFLVSEGLKAGGKAFGK
jgi:hypothetical protein